MLRLRRVVFAGITLAVLVLATTAVGTLSTTRRAQAICSGVGSPLVVYRYDAGGTLVAAEGPPYPGTTCDNDSSYGGLVLDPVTDGSCAYAYYLEPFAYLAQQGVSCTTGAWAPYSYTDTINGNSVYVSVRPSYLGDDWRLSSGY